MTSQSRYTPPDIVALDALALSAAIRRRQVSCREVMTAYLGHIERINPKVNAIVALQDGDALLEQADEKDVQLAAGQYQGWMHGMPHAVKDLALTRGIRTTFGSPLFKDNVPQADDIFVERIRRQGAILIGKTNTPEFGLGSNSYNPVYGMTLNAWDQSRIAGGSSGGAAVALALQLVPVADGSDMMGSLRNPAAYNNVYGFRPSAGAVPSGPGPELYLGALSTNGPMGRNVSDLAMLMSTQAGYDARAPMSAGPDAARYAQPLQRDFKGTRIGWLGDLHGYLPMEDGVMEVCRASFGAFQGLGCSIDEVSRAELDFAPERLWQSWLVHRQSLLAGTWGDAYADPARRALMKPEFVWEVEHGLKWSARDFYRASVERSAWYKALDQLLARYDYLLMPTAQVFPFSAQEHWPKAIAGKPMDTYHRWMEAVIPASLAGAPAISVPVGFGPQGLPMGVQIIGRRFADVEVLQLAYAYEQATHWERRRPALLQA
ncbi:MAG: Acylamidase [Herbaspirillum frisingense]|uniref:Acylamidase n=1 Tax=Herbaspirillum frisingense TaxID=92645 RepID=A0A7V8G0F6_9BURK|nr:MAG: Acylamidase [Herbaspirillum frisingense]